jgi:hypothetical protein
MLRWGDNIEMVITKYTKLFTTKEGKAFFWKS